jgi:uncharacterized protein YkwD
MAFRHRSTSRLPIRYFPVIRFGLLVFLSLVIAGNGVPLTAYGASDAAPASPSDIALQVLGLLNQWRVDQGLWPFKENALLDTTAADQANYVATHLDLNNITSDEAWHKDAQGRMPRARMVAAPYNWPYFGQPERVIVGENAALGSAKSAMTFWKGSPPHRTAALNGAYREIGIAVVPIKGQGYLIYTDFGSRPGVLTTLASATKDTLYFTNEAARYTSWSTGWKPADTQIQITDTNGKVIVDTFPFDKTYKLPGGLSGKIQIQYLNDGTTVTDTINLDSDIAILPGVTLPIAALASSTATASSPAAPTASSTTSSTTATPIAAIPTLTNTAPVVVSSPTATATSTNIPILPTLTSTTPPTFTATSVPTLQPTVPLPTATARVLSALTFSYTPEGLTIRNTSGGTLDLSGFSIGNTTATIPINTWVSLSPFEANAFAADTCLQLQLFGSPLPDSTGCKSVRAVLVVTLNHRFWTEGPFTINKNGVVVWTCDSRVAVCQEPRF